MVIYGHAKAIAPAVEQEDFFVWAGFGHYSGHIAVNIFFLVSGFLVTGSLMRQRNPLNFFKLRALRLVPGYAVNVALLALVLGAVMTTLPVHDYLRSPEVWAYIVKNLHLSSDMAWNLPGVFEQNAKTSTINGSQWTLPAEVRMYVLLGVAGLIGLFHSARVATFATLAILAIGAFVPYYLPLHQDWFRLGLYFSLGGAGLPASRCHPDQLCVRDRHGRIGGIDPSSAWIRTYLRSCHRSSGVRSGLSDTPRPVA